MFHRGVPVNSWPRSSGMSGIQLAALIPSGWAQTKARSKATKGHLSRRSDRHPAKPTHDQSTINLQTFLGAGGVCGPLKR